MSEKWDQAKDKINNGYDHIKDLKFSDKTHEGIENLTNGIKSTGHKTSDYLTETKPKKDKKIKDD